MAEALANSSDSLLLMTAILVWRNWNKTIFGRSYPVQAQNLEKNRPTNALTDLELQQWQLGLLMDSSCCNLGDHWVQWKNESSEQLFVISDGLDSSRIEILSPQEEHGIVQFHEFYPAVF